MFSKQRVTKSVFVGNQSSVIECFLYYYSSRAWECLPPAQWFSIYTRYTSFLICTHFAGTIQLGSITLTGCLMSTLICLLPRHSLKITPQTLKTQTLTLSLCLLFFLHSSDLQSYLSSWVLTLRQQADRFWMSHPICQPPLSPPLSPSLRPWSSITTLSLKGQRREWHLSSQTPLLLRSLCAFFFHLPLPIETKWHLERDSSSPWEPLHILEREHRGVQWNCVVKKGSGKLKGGHESWNNRKR